MRYLRAVSLLTVWVFFASSALATTPPPTAQTASQVPVPVEVTGIQHATHTTGPLVVNWHFKKAPGSANLVVNSDGTYLFSGNYNRKAPEVFDILLGLKSSLGRIYLFNYAGDASNGVQWSKHGKSAILKDDFNTFDKHDWIGSYRFHLTAEGREDKRICLAQPEKVATFFYPVVPSWTGGHCIWVYAY